MNQEKTYKKQKRSIDRQKKLLIISYKRDRASDS